MIRLRILKTAKYMVLVLIFVVMAVCYTSSAAVKEGSGAPQGENIIAAASNDDGNAKAVPSNTGELLLLDLSQQQELDDSGQIQEVSVEGEGDVTDSVGQSYGVLALWINSERVVQTPQQVAEWERGLYNCKTVEEYTAYLDDVAYYNKGIDMSKFPWY